MSTVRSSRLIVRYCIRCDSEIPPRNQFCMMCGTPVRPLGAPRHRRWLVVTGIMVAAAAFGVGVAAILTISAGGSQVRLNAGPAPARQSVSSQNPAPSPAPSPASAPASIVSVAPSAEGDPRVQVVLALLQRYFTAINQHDYRAYASLLAPPVLRQSSASGFASGYASTTDSDATLTGITAASSSGLAARVTFTSHQEPAESPDNSACDHWAITLYLVPDGDGYLITTPPSGYHAAHSAC